jgi:hypothetical protein
MKDKDPIPNRDEDFDGHEFDEFSWLVPHLVKHGFNPNSFIKTVGPALREAGGLTNEDVDVFLEDLQVAAYQKQLKQMKIRRS